MSKVKVGTRVWYIEQMDEKGRYKTKEGWFRGRVIGIDNIGWKNTPRYTIRLLNGVIVYEDREPTTHLER